MAVNEPNQWQIDQAMACLAALRHREQISGDDDELSLLLDNAEQNIEALLRAVINAALENEGIAEAVKERIELLKFRQDRYKRRAEALRGTAFAMMDALGLSKFSMPEFTASVGKPRGGLLITDEAQIPDEYMRVKREPDKARILEDLQNGVEITGAVVANGVPTFTVRSK